MILLLLLCKIDICSLLINSAQISYIEHDTADTLDAPTPVPDQIKYLSYAINSFNDLQWKKAILVSIVNINSTSRQEIMQEILGKIPA